MADSLGHEVRMRSKDPKRCAARTLRGEFLPDIGITSSAAVVQSCAATRCRYAVSLAATRMTRRWSASIARSLWGVPPMGSKYQCMEHSLLRKGKIMTAIKHSSIHSTETLQQPKSQRDETQRMQNYQARTLQNILWVLNVLSLAVQVSTKSLPPL